MSKHRLREKLTGRLRQPWFGGGVGAVLAIGIGLILLLLPLGKGLRDWSYDRLLFFGRGAVQNQSVRIIYLDEKSYRELKQDPANFDHSLHARLIRKLKDAGARLIVFDMLFIDSKSAMAAADQDFAQAMREHGKVILGADYDQVEQLRAVANRVLPPIDPLRDACAGWGIIQIHRDTDSIPRLHHAGTDRLPGLAWKSAEVFGAEITKQLENRTLERWLNYYSEIPFQGISYCDALTGTQDQPDFFKDKVVFIGSGDVAGYTAGEEKDEFRTPWTWASRHLDFGVEIHALTFCNLIQQDWLWRLPSWVETLTVILMGALLGYGLSLFRPLLATGIAFAFVLIVIAVSFAAFWRFNLWFPWLIPVAVQAPIALAWSYLFHSVKSFVETKLLETSLGLYLSPHLVKDILKQPDLLKPGGREKTVTILFSDIASFSKISEGMNPNKLVNELNYYYEKAIGCVHQTDGTVMNLIGDAIFAIWNAPLEQPDHQERAGRAALLLSQQVNHADATGAHPPFRTRIGLHTGVACVGNIGGSAHFNFTAIGESVNMASRLEGLNKQVGTNILMTSEVQKNAGGRFITRLIGQFRFQGFDKVTAVYELVATVESMPSPEPWQLVFAKALENFQHQLFGDAAEGFRQTLVLRPDDGPSKYYLVKISELQSQTLPPEWKGEIHLREK